MKTVMIVAGESSGDLYGSLLAKALKKIWRDVRLVGIGGEKMAAAGVEIKAGITSALGLTEVISSINRIRSSLKAAKKSLIDTSPEVVVLIDYPDFNFRIGKAAKKHGIKVLYYVSPQVWAWRKGRVKTMAEFVDRMAVILPFEEELYKKAGIPCEFVGHPAMEEIEEYEDRIQNTEYRSQNRKPALPNSTNSRRLPTEGGLKPQASGTPHSALKNPLIALLPGSRPNELKTLLPVFIDVVTSLKRDLPACRFVLPIAPNIDIADYSEYIARLEQEGVEITRGKAIAALTSSDAAVIASGTATLQAALLAAPMVVVYKLSPLTYSIGKTILKVKYISLANIIAGRGIVSELIQGRANAIEITGELKKILTDSKYRTGMISSLEEIRGAFSGRSPSQRVAEMTGELAGWKTLRG